MTEFTLASIRALQATHHEHAAKGYYNLSRAERMVDFLLTLVRTPGTVEVCEQRAIAQPAQREESAVGDFRPDSFNNLNFPHMARGDFTWRGFAVVIDPRLQPIHLGDFIKPLMPHPLVQWLLRFFKQPVLPVMFVRAGRIEEEIIYEGQNKLFMSPRAWAQLKSKIPNKD